MTETLVPGGKATAIRSPATMAHAATVAAVLAAVDTSPEGLSSDQATHRLASHGPNRISATRQRSWARALLAQFTDILIYVLLGAAVVTAWLGHVTDTAVIVGVVVINALIGFVQDRRAERSLNAIREMLAEFATVVRDGHRLRVPVEDIVPGDLVVLEAGDKIPADLRLTRHHALQVQEAILTGESLAVDKQLEPVADDAPLGDRTSMAFAGTIVVRGRGRGVVVATGDDTELGRINAMLGRVRTPETPLTRQLAGLGRTLTVFILVLSVVAFAVGYFVYGMPAGELFMTAVGIAVAAIPEGLPAIVTITLAIGVERMARRKAIVRSLPAVETLGAVGVICSDKTGTFTLNEMMVETVVTAGATYTVGGHGYEPAGVITRDGGGASPLGDVALARLALAAALCNDATLRKIEEEWLVDGDPMEGALLAFAAKAGVGIDGPANRATRQAEIPFDPAERFMATATTATNGGTVLHVKGAPERVIAMCNRVLTADGEAPIDATEWNASVTRLSRRGLRVLALAEASIGNDVSEGLSVADIGDDMVFLGLLGLIDPPRPEAIAAVADCRVAGIRVKMITGDHIETALAVAQRLGLATSGKVLSGAGLDRMSDTDLAAAVETVDVFARTNPEHKLRLLRALQASGAVVAMTGDGVNDAPALKQSDVGIAMGRRGSAAAREAARIVLADDNFATIAAAVEEGRRVYDNLRKAITFILPTNGGEAGVLLVAIALGITAPITPLHILWINMITEVTISLALAFEGAEPDLMRRPPRNPRTPILTRFVLWRVGLITVLMVAGTFAIFAWLIGGGSTLAYARTASVNAIVVFEIAYLLSARRLRDRGWTGLLTAGARAAWLAIGLVLAAQLAFTYLPAMNALFDTEPLGLGAWLLILPFAIAIFAISEWEKTRVARRARANGAQSLSRSAT